jgi:hypothetical protein
MEKQIENILIKVDEGTMPVQQALTELLLLFSVSGSLCDYCKHDKKAVCCQSCLDDMIEQTANTQ